MKKLRKALAVLLSAAMVLGMGLSSAAATGNLTADTSVTVGGLEENDVVKFVKAVEWVDSTGWAYTAKIVAAAQEAGVTLPDIAVITGNLTGDDGKKVPAAISAANGGILGKAAAKATGSNATAGTDKTATLSKGTDQAEADFVGLYVALVTPADPEYNYNPVFVSADFSQKDTSPNTFTVDLNKSYQPTALAKKNHITVDKTATGSNAELLYDVNVGDTIPFAVTSQIPAFSSSYVNPVYEITDTLDTGLEFNDDLAVKIGGTDAVEDTDYTVVSSSATGYTIAVTAAKLAAIQESGLAQDIVITYTATVQEIPEANIYNVVQKENRAQVKFSNDPGNKDSYSLLEDRTNHYTFSLDSKLLGNDQYITGEMLKIGLDENGDELTQTHTASNSTPYAALEGAKFKLYTDAEGKTPYTSDQYPNGCEVESNEDGLIPIVGLDVGTYYLFETQAPTGFVKSNDPVVITIEAEYQTIDAGSYVNEDGITVKYNAYDVLESYTVTVGGQATIVDGEHVSTYTFTKTQDASESDVEIVDVTDVSTKIKNIRGTELPATGGTGTTLFYIIGSILVIGAGIILVAKKRMSME